MNQGTKCFSRLNDPLILGVLYLPKYFGNFTNFTSHTKSIYLKNISRDCSNTNLACRAWLQQVYGKQK